MKKKNKNMSPILNFSFSIANVSDTSFILILFVGSPLPFGKSLGNNNEAIPLIFYSFIGVELAVGQFNVSLM